MIEDIEAAGSKLLERLASFAALGHDDIRLQYRKFTNKVVPAISVHIRGSLAVSESPNRTLDYVRMGEVLRNICKLLRLLELIRLGIVCMNNFFKNSVGGRKGCLL